MYFRDKHPERREQMETVLDPVRELGLHIFARNGEVDEKYAWPEKYRPHIVGELPYDQMLAAYRMYKVFLNVNSVLDSPDHVRAPRLRAVGLRHPGRVRLVQGHRGDLRRPGARSPASRSSRTTRSCT